MWKCHFYRTSTHKLYSPKFSVVSKLGKIENFTQLETNVNKKKLKDKKT